MPASDNQTWVVEDREASYILTNSFTKSIDPDLGWFVDTKPEEWETKTLEDVAVIDPIRSIKKFNINSFVSIIMMNEVREYNPIPDLSKKNLLCNVPKGGFTLFIEGDVLLAKMSPCFENGKSAIATGLENGIGIGSTEFFVLRANGKLTKDIIYQIVSNEIFIKRGSMNMTGTTGRKRLMKSFVCSFAFKLPPIHIQTRLTEIFNSLETRIAETHTIEVNLRALKKALLNELFQEHGKLGNLVQPGDCSRVRFGDVARQVKTNIDYKQTSLTRFVAGEHMETDELVIRQWGNITTNTELGSAFKSKFSIGHILYGSRRAYLRKVAIANFEGICANTTFIIETTDAHILNQRYLAYMMQSEDFTRFSINSSKGSTNPYINFGDLNNYIFTLVSLNAQKEVVVIFDSIESRIGELRALRESLQALKKALVNHIIC